MLSEAHVWWNGEWLNSEDINSGGAGMGVYGSGVCFEQILRQLHMYGYYNVSIVMETSVNVQPGKNVNGNFMGKIQIEQVHVLDRYRYGGVRLYQGEFLFVWNNIVGAGQWSQLFAMLQRLWQQHHRMYRVFIGGDVCVSW